MLEVSETDTDASTGQLDAGFTLLEVLIAMVLMATILGAIMTATHVNIRASATARTAARVESVVVNVADRLNRAPKSCDYTIYGQAAALTEQWPASTVSLQQWHYAHSKYDPSPTASGEWLPGACDSALSAAPDLLVQKLRVTVTSPDGEVTRFIEVVKSDV